MCCLSVGKEYKTEEKRRIGAPCGTTTKNLASGGCLCLAYLARRRMVTYCAAKSANRITITAR
jgi:hypothetical protein